MDAARPWRGGEYILAAGKSGTVGEIGPFTTIPIADDLSFISIPDAAIFGGVIVNTSRDPFTLVTITVAIDFSSDVDEAQAIIFAALGGDERVRKTPTRAPGIAIPARRQATALHAEPRANGREPAARQTAH